MKAILAAIQAKQAQVDRLNIEIGALQAVYNAEAGIKEVKPRAGRSDVKSTVLRLLERVGANGLNAQIACELAKEDGAELQIKSVSSLLSRMKADGVVVHTGNVYVLKDMLPKQPSSPPTEMGSVVRPLRASGQMP